MSQIDKIRIYNVSTVKPVLNDLSKIDKPKIVMTNGSLMKVESVAEGSPWSRMLQKAPLGAFCNTFDLI